MLLFVFCLFRIALFVDGVSSVLAFLISHFVFVLGLMVWLCVYSNFPQLTVFMVYD